jgi:hypothetical protein
MRSSILRRHPVLGLFAVCALLVAGAAPTWAAAAVPAVPAVASTVATPFAVAVPSGLPEFLQPVAASGLPTTGVRTGCRSDAQCPTGQLCCLACGFFGCNNYACFAPMNGHCPYFP